MARIIKYHGKNPKKNKRKKNPKNPRNGASRIKKITFYSHRLRKSSQLIKC